MLQMFSGYGDAFTDGGIYGKDGGTAAERPSLRLLFFAYWGLPVSSGCSGSPPETVSSSVPEPALTLSSLPLSSVPCTSYSGDGLL